MSYVAINGIDIPVAKGTPKQTYDPPQTVERAFGGSLHTDRSVIKRVWTFDTVYLSAPEADSLAGMLLMRGEAWPFDGDFISFKGRAPISTQGATITSSGIFGSCLGMTTGQVRWAEAGAFDEGALSFWYSPTSLVTSTRYLGSLHPAAANYQTQNGSLRLLLDHTALYLRAFTPSGAQRFAFRIYHNGLTAGRWYFVAAGWRAGWQYLRLYRQDGLLAQFDDNATYDRLDLGVGAFTVGNLYGKVDELYLTPFFVPPKHAEQLYRKRRSFAGPPDLLAQGKATGGLVVRVRADVTAIDHQDKATGDEKKLSVRLVEA
jgi:hypothetical protein